VMRGRSLLDIKRCGGCPPGRQVDVAGGGLEGTDSHGSIECGEGGRDPIEGVT
jgi:hypothetical protein